MGTRFIVVQHAEKEALPGVPGLSPLGVMQAETIAARLVQIEMAAVYSSPMCRARQTGAHIAGRLGLSVTVEDRLTERMNWAGDQPLDAFLAEWARSTTERDFQPRSGESSRAAGVRLERALCDLARRHPDQTVVVIGHGGVTIDLARNLVGDEAVEVLAPGVIHGGIPSCSITEIVADSGRLRVVALADSDGVQNP